MTATEWTALVLAGIAAVCAAVCAVGWLLTWAALNDHQNRIEDCQVYCSNGKSLKEAMEEAGVVDGDEDEWLTAWDGSPYDEYEERMELYAQQTNDRVESFLEAWNKNIEALDKDAEALNKNCQTFNDKLDRMLSIVDGRTNNANSRIDSLAKDVKAVKAHLGVRDVPEFQGILRDQWVTGVVAGQPVYAK